MSKLNWGSIKAWWWDPTTKRFGYAVLISACIHLLFIEQSDWVTFSTVANPFHSIDAELVSVSPKMTAPAIEITRQKQEDALGEAAAPEKIEQKKPEPKVTETKVAESDTPKPDTSESGIPDAETINQQTNRLDVAPAHDLASDEEIIATDEVSQAVPSDEAEQGLVLPDTSEQQEKPQPFTMVETDFDVRMNDSLERVGTAKIHYAKSTNQSYELVWKVSATGLLGMVYPDLMQTSQGVITEAGLLPHHYAYKFGSREDKMYQAEFNWAGKEVELHSSKGNKKTAIAADAKVGHTQDILSFMYQFMFAPPLEEMQMYLTNGKKLDLYDYAFEGEETLELKFGNVRTYHIQHAKADTDESTELWLAMDYRYVPVKIRKTEKDGTVIEQIATRLKFETIENETPLP